MTFTEAAVEVLRLAGKPLHYKTITDIAIERNLLSHVGKTPEITMSSRLATMVKKDRGEAPIIKVKPGVFGLRDFPEEVIAAAANETGHEYDLPEEETRVSETEELDEVSARATPEEEKPQRRSLPGADVFPEEDDDDEPILKNLQPRSAERAADDLEGDDGKNRRRRRRRRRRKGEGPGGEEGNERSERNEPAQARRATGEETREHDMPGPDRERAQGELVGKDLADAIHAVLGGAGSQPASYVRVAELLVRRGRLTGDPGMLVPTIAAAVRGDHARREAQRVRPRFRTAQGLVSLTDWSMPSEAVRAEDDAVRAADRQRDVVRRAFARRLGELPAVGLMEIIAAWLNAESVVSLRAVRRPSANASDFHLAGTLRRGADETRLAIVVCRDGSSIGRERVIDVRGALHHYGNASVAWLITTGQVLSGARDEAAVPSVSPCAIFDGVALARAMESAGIGLRRHWVPVVAMDLDLLDALSGSTRDSRSRQRDRDRDRDGGRDRSRRDGERGRDNDRRPRELPARGQDARSSQRGVARDEESSEVAAQDEVEEMRDSGVPSEPPEETGEHSADLERHEAAGTDEDVIDLDDEVFGASSESDEASFGDPSDDLLADEDDEDELEH